MANNNKVLIGLICLCIAMFSCKMERERPSTNSTRMPSPKSLDTNNITKGSQLERELSVSPQQLAKAKTIIGNVDPVDVNAVNPKKIFKSYCAICHGFNGNAMINGAKNLTKSVISIEEAVAQIYFGKGLMIPYKSTLSEAEIVAMATYVEEFRK